MDDLQNYVNLSQAVTEGNEAYKEKVANISELAKEKIKELTNPIGEGFMIEGAKGALTKSVDNLAKNLRGKGMISEDTADLVNAYRKGGVKGVVKHLGKKMRNKAQDAVGNGEQVEAQNITDLSPEEFDATKGTISTTLKHRFQNEFTENKQNSIARKYNNEKLDETDEPDIGLRQQQNAQKFNDIMEEQSQRSEALGQEGENALKQSVLNNADDNVLNETKQSISGVVKNLNTSAEDEVESTALKATRKEVIKSAEEKAGKRMATEDLEEGGPEDVVGDVVSGLVGIGTFLGGLFASRHIKEQSPADNVANVSYQSGT